YRHRQFVGVKRFYLHIHVGAIDGFREEFTYLFAFFFRQAQSNLFLFLNKLVDNICIHTLQLHFLTAFLFKVASKVCIQWPIKYKHIVALGFGRSDKAILLGYITAVKIYYIAI